MNWAKLQDQIYNASREAVAEVCSSILNEKLYAFALYTDSGFMSIGPASNSLEKLDEKILSDLDDNDKTYENIAYYKWSTSEWAYEGRGGEFFSEINKCLRESVDRKNFEDFKGRLIESMINALSQLVRDNNFSKIISSDVIFFLTVTDDDDAENLENISAKKINDEILYKGFISRYEPSSN